MARHETPDSTPLALPVRFRHPPTLEDRMRALIRSEALQREAEQAGYETFEEADDFEIGDDFDPSSPYELGFDPELEPPLPLEEPQPAPREPGAEPSDSGEPGSPASSAG